MRILLFLVTLFVINFEADAIEIVCDYRINYNVHRIHAYACEVQSMRLLSSDDCELTSVTGDHKPGKSNDDVTFLYSTSRTFNYFPKITNFFKNIDAVLIFNANIATIDKSDLQQFGSKLTYLDLGDNKLEVIDSDLFEYTPNIGMFILHTNQIKYVGRGAFGKLQKLSWLRLESNPCHSGSAGDKTSSVATNRPAINTLIATIERKCNDPQALVRLIHIKTEEIKKEVAKLTTERNFVEEAAKSKAEIEKLKAEIAKLLLVVETKNQNEALNEKNVEIIKKLIELEAKFERSEGKLDILKQQMDSVVLSVEKSKDSTLKDLILENFTSLNATCSAFDYKLDLLNRDCISRPCHRQPYAL